MEHGMLGWMTQLAQDRPSINVVQHVIVIAGQILESTVIEKNIIRTLSAFQLRSNPNRSECWINRRGCHAGAISRHFNAWPSALIE
jgi:hypothetical protein